MNKKEIITKLKKWDCNIVIADDGINYYDITEIGHGMGTGIILKIKKVIK